MKSLNYHEDQRSITQDNSAPHGTQVGLPSPGTTSMHDQVSNIAKEKVSYQFSDFITPNPSSSIWVKGSRVSLNSLELTLNCGGRVQRIVKADQEFAAYTPFATSINFVCARLGLDPITERDLVLLQYQPWFKAFLKQFVNRHRAEGTIDYSKFGDVNLLTGDRMVLLLEALEFIGRLPKIGLGFVVHDNSSPPWVIHYPCGVPEHHLTAWVLVETRSTGTEYRGFENSATQRQAPSPLQYDPQKQPGVPQQQLSWPNVQEQQRFPLAPQPLLLNFQKESHDEMDEDDEDAADGDEKAIETPKATPRKTAARVLAQQVPLPAGMSVDEILKKHPERVHYNNMLKVALKLSNKDIARLLLNHGLTLASGVVKRINTALEYIESEFDIEEDAFRTTFDRERKAADIPTRGKEEVSDEILTANASKIAVAMTWVKTGGPRPAPTTSITSVTSLGQSIASPFTMGAAPFAGSHAATTASPYTAPLADPYVGPVSGPYNAPVAGLSAAPVPRGYAPRFGGDGSISTSSQDLALTFNDNDSPPGYAPASHIPIHTQRSFDAPGKSGPDDVFHDYDTVGSGLNDFQGSANAPSPSEGSQMDTNGSNMNGNDNDNDTVMDGDDSIDWGKFMKQLPSNFLD